MEIRYTEPAREDLADILSYLALNYPNVIAPFQERLRQVAEHISRWPTSARSVPERPGARSVPLGRYPYVIYYDVTESSVDILHIYHAARRQPWDEEQL